MPITLYSDLIELYSQQQDKRMTNVAVAKATGREKMKPLTTLLDNNRLVGITACWVLTSMKMMSISFSTHTTKKPSAKASSSVLCHAARLPSQ